MATRLDEELFPFSENWFYSSWRIIYFGTFKEQQFSYLQSGYKIHTCPVTFSAICKCNLNENESICLYINSALNTSCIFISVSLLTQLMTRLWPHQFEQIFHEKYWSLLRLKYNHLSPEASAFLFKNIIKLGTFQCKLAKRILNPQNQRQNWLLW